MSLFIIGLIGATAIYCLPNSKDYLAFLIIMLVAMAPRVLLEVFNFPTHVRNNQTPSSLLRLVVLYAIFCAASEPLLSGQSYWWSFLARCVPVIIIYPIGAIYDYRKHKKDKIIIMTPKVKK